RPPTTTLFPYTTLFRSAQVEALQGLGIAGDTHWGGRAGFDAGEHRVRAIETADLLAERRQCLADGLDRVLRQRRRQITQAHAGLVGGFHLAERARGHAANEVTDQ